MIKEIIKAIYLISFFFISSCSSDVVFTDSKALKDNIWHLSDVPEFNVPVTDTAQLSDVSFTIRTGSDYPFRNIFLFVTAYSPDGKSISDTLEYYLADEKGKWYGKGFGDIHELNLPYKSGVFFPVRGTYRFEIKHGMRILDLKGVYDFGLRIAKSPK